jgi:flagellar motor switch protein FliM
VLTTSLRAVSSLSLTQVEELSYDEYLTGMPEGAVCAVLSMDPLPGKALLTLDQTTLLTMIDHLLGGPGAEKQPDRPLTDIEQSLVRHLLGRLLRELAYALEPITTTTPNIIGLESNVQFIQAAAATDPVIAARMEITVGARTSVADVCFPYAMLSPAFDMLSATDPVVAARMEIVVGRRTSVCDLCLPYAMLAPALQMLSDNPDQRERASLRREAAALTTQRLGDVDIEVAVRFEPVRLPSAQIGRLRIGDVLTLGHRTSRPLTVTSANTTFAHAIPGSSGKRLAALIVAAQ